MNKSIFLAGLTAFGLMCGLSEAAMLNIPGASGTTINASGSNCSRDEEGTLEGLPATGTEIPCEVIFALPIETDKILDSISVYYIDSAAPSSIFGSLYQTGLTPGSGLLAETLISDTTFASGVRSFTRNYNQTLSSSFTYYIYLTLDDHTKLKGFRVVYH